MAKPTEDLDIITYRGDTDPLKMAFYDINNQRIDITQFTIKWTVRDEYKDIDGILQKTRIGGTPDGIITVDDLAASDYAITENNQIAVLRTVDDTKNWRTDVYPFDIEFAKGANVYTAARGNLIVQKDMSRNV